MLNIGEADVERLLDLNELRAAMETALIAFSTGRVTQPVRSVVRIEQHGGWLGLMPAVYGDVMGAKLVTVFPQNRHHGLHTHNAVIQLFETKTGEPLALVGGRLMTACRTAAVSALAVREFAVQTNPVLAILGSGVQARSHCRALQLVRYFEQIRVWSPTAEHASRCAEEIGAVVTPTAQAAAEDADVVLTVTAANQPVLKGAWLKKGALVLAVGAVGLQARELDDDAMRRGVVIVDSRAAAERESGDIAGSGAEIFAELGEILGQTVRLPEREITVFKSLGLAIEDIAAAKLVYDTYLATNSAGAGEPPPPSLRIG